MILLTSTRTRSSVHISNVIHGGSLRVKEPRGTVQFQWCLIAIVLDVLTAIQRVWDQFLKHLSGELPVLDVEREIRFCNWSDIDLRGQIMLHDSLRRVFDRLELAFDQGRRKSTISVDVDFVHIVLGVSQQC